MVACAAVFFLIVDYIISILIKMVLGLGN
jgi:preprotein translocase subunit SecE